MRGAVVGVLLVACAVVPGRAWSAELDVSRLAIIEGGDVMVSNNTAITRLRLLASELAFAMVPKSASAARTLGMAGFEFSLEAGLVHIDNTADHWRLTTALPGSTDSTVPGTLFVPQAHVRKGLPFSFEVGGTFAFLTGTNMFLVGGDVQWALQEGYFPIPDLAVRAGLSRIVGNRQMSLTVLHADAVVSLEFPVDGVLTLTPYIGYGQVLVDVATDVLDTTPGDLEDNLAGSSLFVFPHLSFGETHMHRLAGGLRLHTSILAIAYQVDVALVPGAEGTVVAQTLKIGLDF